MIDWLRPSRDNMILLRGETRGEPKAEKLKTIFENCKFHKRPFWFLASSRQLGLAESSSNHLKDKIRINFLIEFQFKWASIIACKEADSSQLPARCIKREISSLFFWNLSSRAYVRRSPREITFRKSSLVSVQRGRKHTQALLLMSFSSRPYDPKKLK